MSDSDKTYLMFTAEWCGPCTQVKESPKWPTAKSQDNFVVYDVDDEEGAEMASEYNVQSVPSVVLIEDGEPKKAVSGFDGCLQAIEEAVTQ